MPAMRRTGEYLRESVKSFSKNYDFPVERLQPEATIESIGLDSLDKVEFLFALEKEFNVKIPDREVTLNTIQDVINVIERLTHEAKGQSSRQDG
jgi:acyl carrier protein